MPTSDCTTFKMEMSHDVALLDCQGRANRIRRGASVRHPLNEFSRKSLMDPHQILQKASRLVLCLFLSFHVFEMFIFNLFFLILFNTRTTISKNLLRNLKANAVTKSQDTPRGSISKQLSAVINFNFLNFGKASTL